MTAPYLCELREQRPTPGETLIHGFVTDYCPKCLIVLEAERRQNPDYRIAQWDIPLSAFVPLYREAVATGELNMDLVRGGLT